MPPDAMLFPFVSRFAYNKIKPHEYSENHARRLG
jgi:hypothetical protein